MEEKYKEYTSIKTKLKKMRDANVKTIEYATSKEDKRGIITRLKEEYACIKRLKELEADTSFLFYYIKRETDAILERGRTA